MFMLLDRSKQKFGFDCQSSFFGGIWPIRNNLNCLLLFDRSDMTKWSSFVEWCLRFITPAKFCSINNTREVTSHVPEYFQNQTVPTVSYNYANTVAPQFSIAKRHCGTLMLWTTYKISINVIALIPVPFSYTVNHLDMS